MADSGLPPLNSIGISVSRRLFPRRRRLLGIAVGVTLLSCGGDEPAAPNFIPGTDLPSTLVLLAPEAQTGIVGEPVPEPPGVQVIDQRGLPVAGVVVQFAVTPFSGVVSEETVVTDVRGIARIEHWTLTTVSGRIHRLRALVSEGPAVDFFATSLPGPVEGFELLSGGDQSVLAGTHLLRPLVLRAFDAFGNGVPEIDFEFQLDLGSGGLETPSAATGADGTAEYTGWVLGDAPGPNRLSVRIANRFTSSVEISATGLGPPTRMIIEAGAGQIVPPNQATPVLPATRLIDDAGTPIPGVFVTFVASDSLSIPDPTTVRTDEAGVARPGVWRSGSEVGVETLRAESEGIESVSWVLSVVEEEPFEIQALGTTSLSGAVGAEVADPPRVRVVGQDGEPLANVPVNFQVVSGGGFMPPGPFLTDANGEVVAAGWILGPTAEANTLSASVTGLFQLGFSVLATGASGPAYDVEIRLQTVHPLSQTFIDILRRVEMRWQSAIVGDLPSVNTVFAAEGTCPVAPETVTATVDDLLIFVGVQDFDGVGGILGFAAQCFVRDSDRLAVAGRLALDTQDVAQLITSGRLEAVLLHEFAHIIGFTPDTWTDKNLLRFPSNPNSNVLVDTHFSGAQARAEFALAGGGAYTGGAPVPVENDIVRFGAGGLNSHWRESVFGNELMSPSLATKDAPLSRVTLAALEDIGYQVDRSVADPYQLPSTALRVEGGPGFAVPEFREVVGGFPVGVVDPSGRIVRFLRR